MSRVVLPPKIDGHHCGLWFVLTRAPWWSYKAYTYLSKPEKPCGVRWLNRAKKWLVRIILCSPALMVVLLLLRGLPLTLPWLAFCVAPLVIYLFLPAVQYLRPRRRYYRAQNGTALLAVTAKPGRWHFDDHMAAQLGARQGKALRDELLPKLAQAADDANVTVTTTAASDGLADAYIVSAGKLDQPVHLTKNKPGLLGRVRLHHTHTGHQPR